MLPGLHSAKKNNKKDLSLLKQKSEIGLELLPILEEKVILFFYLLKILTNFFQHFLMTKIAVKAQLFIANYESKHQWEASVSMASFNSH